MESCGGSVNLGDGVRSPPKIVRSLASLFSHSASLISADVFGVSFCVLPPMVGPPREEGGVRVLAQRRSEKRFLFVGAKKRRALSDPAQPKKERGREVLLLLLAASRKVVGLHKACS